MAIKYPFLLYSFLGYMMAIKREIQVFASIREFLEKPLKIRSKLAQKLLSLGFSSIMK